MLAWSPQRRTAMADRNAPDADRPAPLHKRAHPLFWLLILAALFALGWSFYNHHAGESMPAPISPDVAPATTPPPPPTPPAKPNGTR